MTLITPDGVYLVGVIDGAPVYTAWSRRADPRWLADQLDSVPSEVRGPGGDSATVASHDTGDSLSTLRTCAAERPAPGCGCSNSSPRRRVRRALRGSPSGARGSAGGRGHPFPFQPSHGPRPPTAGCHRPDTARAGEAPVSVTWPAVALFAVLAAVALAALFWPRGGR